MEVTATSGENERVLSEVQAITVTVTDDDTEAPNKPAAPTVAQVPNSLTQLAVSWVAPANKGPGITAYDVRYILTSDDEADDNNWTEVEDAWNSDMHTEFAYTISPLTQNTSYDVQVRAKNAEGTGEWSKSGVGMTAQNQVPVFADISPLSFEENSTAAIVTVSASDADTGDNITGYSIVDGADGSQFSIDEQTGALSFIAAPNYEAPTDVAVTDPGSGEADNEYIVFVEATSGEGTRLLTSRATIKVTVSDENEKPVFSSAMTFEVAENEQSVGTVVADDVDRDDSITGYGIVDGGDGSQFSITDMGALSFQTAPNFEVQADADTDNVYILEVKATSGENERVLSEVQAITVTVTDVEEAPGVPAAPTVSASTLNSLTIRWDAPTNTGPEIIAHDVRYILTSADETDDANWTEVEDAWQSDMHTDFAYTISPLTQNTSYDVQVRAENAEGMSAWSDTVVGMTAQNQVPVFVTVQPQSFEENSTLVVTVSATDADATDNITGYGIVEDADGSQFSIVAATGVLSFKIAPNYEDPEDVQFTDAANSTNDNAASNNEYIVIVIATSGTGVRELTARDTLTVTVNDIAEPPGKPDVPTVAEATLNSLRVQWTVPTNTGPEISSYDVRSILTSESDADKTDDKNWTVKEDVWTSSNGGPLAYRIDDLAHSTSYDIQVRAENDEGISVWSDSGAGMTIQNHAPVFAEVSPISVNENSTGAVVTVNASDADAADNITGYSIVEDADGSQFLITDTGALTFKVAPNFEAPTDVAVTDPESGEADNEYIVVVTATSGEGTRLLTDRATLTITVTNVEEPPDKPAAPTVSASTLNSLTISWNAPTNKGPEIIAHDVRYIPTSDDETDDANWTEVENAWWSSDTPPDLTYEMSSLEQNTSYDIQVRAKNAEGTGEWSESGVGTTNQNQLPTFSDGTSTTRSFAENTGSGEDIGDAVSAIDKDGGTLTYSLEGTDAESFSIISESGQFQTKDGILYDYEDKNSYLVIVKVEDGQGGSVTIDVTITLTDVNEAPVFSSAGAFTVAESEQAVGTVVADDVDSEDSITGYTITGGDDQNKFSLVSETGALSFTTAPNYEMPGDGDGNNTYLVEVRATSGVGDRALSVVQAITVSVQDENEKPIFAAVSPITVSENSTGAIVTVVATDNDAADNIKEYGIVEDADGSQFSITDAGVLTFKVAPNFEVPTDVAFSDPTNPAYDSEAGDNNYIVIVSAMSGAGARVLTVRDTLTVSVTDVEEPPDQPAAPTLAEATLNSLRVQWTAPPNKGPGITAYDVRYILNSASDADKENDDNWTEVEDAWKSDMHTEFAYTISPLTQNTSYDIQVRAKNEEGTGEWSDSGVGMTAQNHAPVFAEVSPITVAENSTAAIVTVSATDADADDSITGYGIVEDADGAQFSIVKATGVLSFIAAPNYEVPTDVAVTNPVNAAGDNEYIVFVEATSGEDARVLTATQTVTVTVSNQLGEAPEPPAIPTIAEATLNSLKMEWTTPDNTGPSITAYDVRYILTSESDADKADDNNWTLQEDVWTSSLGGPLAYTIDDLTHSTSYDIQVRAENEEGIGEWSESGVGMTAQNQVPVFADISPLSFEENSTAAIVTVSASDADSEDSITGYGIVEDADGSQFSIVEATGVLSFKTAPNYEDPEDVQFTDAANSTNDNAAGDNEYIVIVISTSGTGVRELTARDTLTVTVNDIAEPPGKPDVPTVAEATLNSLKVQWTAPPNTGPEISSYDVRSILTSESDADKTDDNNWTLKEDAWRSDMHTEFAYTISPLPQNTSYDVQVRAKNEEGTGVWSDSGVGMTAQNQGPVFAAVSPLSVSENSTGVIVTVSATDDDEDDSITGYGIVDGADGEQFSMVAATGVLTFTTAPNYEDPKDVEFTDLNNSDNNNAAENNEYIVVVSARSGEDVRELTVRDMLTITVTDEEEPPGKPAAPSVASSTFNSLTVSWSAPTNTGPAINSYDVRYILSGAADKANDANWTVDDDAWTSGGALEYTISPLDQNTGYDIQVRAKNDEGTGDWSESGVGMTAQNQAPVFADISPLSFKENSTAAIVTVSAMDADSEDSITGYGIVDGADGSQFSIVKATGVLSFDVPPNYEDPTDVEVADPANAEDNNEYIIIVTATSGEGARVLTATQTITVTVTDVDEAPGVPATPTIAEATLNSLKMQWTEPDNTGPAITAYDVRYILTSESDADKADDNNWTLKEDVWRSDMHIEFAYTISPLTQHTSYDVQVRAKNDEGIGEWSESGVGMTAQNQAPIFSDGTSTSRSFAENTAAGQNIGTPVIATDNDGGTLVYSLQEDDATSFTLISESGQLQTKDGILYDYEDKNSYLVMVKVEDGQGGSATIAVTVTVTDVDTEAPGVPAAPTIAEATVNSLKISWDTPTNTGPSITAYDVRYILTSDDETDDDNWMVKVAAWKSDTNTDLTYTISPLTQNTSYDVQVRAKNAEGTGEWSESGVGMTAQNQAPVFAAVSPISVSENSTGAIVTVSATDADTDDSITGYGIVDGADGEQFSIVEATGVLTFKVAPNFEMPTDVAVTDPESSANDNEYIVFVEATSGEGARVLTATQTVTVTVSNQLGEAPEPPAIPTIADATLNSLRVQWTTPDNTGPSITAYDVRYILTSESDVDKTDDNNWTVKEDVWTSSNGGPLAYTIDDLAHSTSYDVQVRAENEEGTGEWSDSGVGMTIQNHAPVFADISPLSFEENSTGAVVTVSASDADEDDSITGYSIVEDADGEQFSIVEATGVLTFKVAPNFEMPTDVAVTDPESSANDNEYIVFVEATSGEGARALTATQTVTVTVSNQLGEAPEPPAIPTIAEATLNSLRVQWTTPDNTGPPITAYDVRYIFTSESDADKTDDNNWTLQEDAWTSGSLEYTISLLSQNTSYDVQVRAENDEGISAWSASATGMTAQNQAPVFADVSPISVSENSTGAVVTVSATDADEDDSITGYGIVEDADGEQFSIVAATGVLSFDAPPNYEAPTDVAFTDAANSANDNAAGNNEYIVIVTATSGEGARALTARDTITVTVEDVNEAPGVPAAPTLVEATLNSLKVQWTAPPNTGPPISAYDVRYILTSDDEANDNNWTEVEDAWKSDMHTEFAYTISPLTQNTSYDVQVRAKNAEGTGEWSESSVGTTNQNQLPMFSEEPSTTRSFAENTGSGEDIGTPVAATDEDGGTLVYSLEGDDAGSFDLVTDSGQLETKANVTYDYEDKNSYLVVVRVVDGQGGSATIAVTVSVTDVEEPPGKPAAPIVASTTFSSLTVQWTAPPNTGPSISAYDVRHILSSASETDKADDAKWTLRENAWMSGGGSLEYTISALLQNKGYDIQVRAENAEGISAWSASATGMTAQNQAPVFAAASPPSVSENSTGAIITVSATDADADDDITGYGIVDGGDGEQFSMVAATGVLTFTTAPNYEDPEDVEFTDLNNSDNNNAAENNEYIVIVSATSGEGARVLTATQTVTVTVEDVDTEAPGTPDTPTIAEATLNSLEVQWTAPDNKGPDIRAYDVRYILSSASDADKADENNWTVQEESWKSTVGGPLAYTIDDLAHSTSYDVQVRAKNEEGTGVWSDSGVGMTVENQAPVFTDVSPITVAENSTAALVTVSASDADADDNITGYGIDDSADGSQFSINEENGELRFNTPPNFESPTDVEFTDPDNSANNNEADNNEYIVIVTATSGEGARALTARDTITVTVEDVNEAPGVPAAPTVSSSTLNSLTIRWDAPTNTGPGISAYDVRYILTSDDETDDANWTEVEDAWKSDMHTDFAYTISPLTQNTSYDVQVRSKNAEGTGEWSESGIGTTNQNQLPTFSDGSSTTRSFAENTRSGEDIGTPVNATDNDGGTLVYSLEGDDAGSCPDGGTGAQLTKLTLTLSQTVDSLRRRPMSSMTMRIRIVIW